MRYFAYGSNLDPDQMRERCPAARFVCIARLDDYRLAFSRKSIRRGCGVADVIPDPGQSVWGAVFELTDADATRLDASEGFQRERKQNSYHRKRVTVAGFIDRAEQPMVVDAYIASPQSDPPPPNAEYIAQIVKGARHWRLPDEYIAELLKLAPSRT